MAIAYVVLDLDLGQCSNAEVGVSQVASRGASPRTVNKHRELVCAIYSYGCREATFSVAHNPAIAADRRPEPESARLDFFSPEEVEAIARADDDRQDAALVGVAAYTGT
jgi:integrase